MRKKLHLNRITKLTLVTLFCVTAVLYGMPKSTESMSQETKRYVDNHNIGTSPFMLYETEVSETQIYEFVDYDNRLIETVSVSNGDPIPYPTPPYRAYTVFVEWVLVSNEGNHFLYKATYALDQYPLEIKTLFKIYDGQPFELTVLNPIDGLTYALKQTNISNTRVHSIDVLLYLDGIYQYASKHQLLIIQDFDSVTYKDKDKIKNLYNFLEILNENDRALLQIEIDRLILEYNLYIDHVNTIYQKTEPFKFNFNVYAAIGSIQLTIIGL